MRLQTTDAVRVRSKPRGYAVSEFAQSQPPVGRRRGAAAANRSWWDAEAEDYYAEHGAFLGDEDFV